MDTESQGGMLSLRVWSECLTIQSARETMLFKTKICMQHLILWKMYERNNSPNDTGTVIYYFEPDLFNIKVTFINVLGVE